MIKGLDSGIRPPGSAISSDVFALLKLFVSHFSLP